MGSKQRTTLSLQLILISVIFQSANIRTIIKARGISYPNVTGKTFAVFRLDNKHHLMSIVSKIDPSPDWIVGVSSLELCLRNCSWLETKVLNLYPWDVGTDDGITYLVRFIMQGIIGMIKYTVCYVQRSLVDAVGG